MILTLAGGYVCKMLGFDTEVEFITYESVLIANELLQSSTRPVNTDGAICDVIL